MTTEKQLTAHVKYVAELYGWLFFHVHRSQFSPAGFPDCVMLSGGRIVVAELKVGKNQPSPEQCEWLEAFHDAGAETFLWRESDEDWAEIQEVLK